MTEGKTQKFQLSVEDVVQVPNSDTVLVLGSNSSGTAVEIRLRMPVAAAVLMARALWNFHDDIVTPGADLAAALLDREVE